MNQLKSKFKLKEINPTFVLLMLIVLVNALSYSMIMPLLYPYAVKYGLSKQTIGILFATFSFFQFIFTPIIGRLSDKFGRKPLLFLSVLGTSASLFLFAIAPNTLVLFLARALDGITGGNMSVAQAVISDLYPAKKRAKFFGLIGGTWGISFLIGPVVGGVLSRFGLAVPFYFASFLALLAAFLILVFLPETLDRSKLKKQRKLDLPSLGRFLHQPFIRTILFASFVSAMVTNMLMVVLQVVGVDQFQLTPEHLGYLMMIFGLTQILMQAYGIGWWLRRWPDKLKFLEIGFYVQGVSLVFAGFLFNLGWFVFFMTLFQIGFAPIRPVAAGILSERADHDRQGVIMGVNQSVLSLGRVVGPLIAGFLLGSNMHFPFWLSAFSAVILALLILWLQKTKTNRS